MKKLFLTIRTPLETTFENDIKELKIDTDAGRMVILPGHAPLTSTVTFSKIVVVTDGGSTEYFVKRGTLSVSLASQTIDLMCMTCEEVKEVSLQTIDEYIDLIQEKLANKESLTEYQIQYLQDEKIAFEKQKQEVA
jgi:F0F1-type ATP synthase epsilon subunit